RDVAAEMRRAFTTFELGQLVDGEVDLAGRAAQFVAVDLADELVVEVFFADELLERQVRVAVRDHELRFDLVAVFHHDARRAVALDVDVRNGGRSTDFRAVRFRRASTSHRDLAGAALGEAPRTERAVDLTHIVVKENVGGTGRLDAEVRADDA